MRSFLWGKRLNAQGKHDEMKKKKKNLVCCGLPLCFSSMNNFLAGAPY